MLQTLDTIPRNIANVCMFVDFNFPGDVHFGYWELKILKPFFTSFFEKIFNSIYHLTGVILASYTFDYK